MCAVLRQDDNEQPVIPEHCEVIDKGGQKPSSHVLPMNVLKKIQRLADGILHGHITLYIEDGEYLGQEHAKRDFPMRLQRKVLDA